MADLGNFDATNVEPANGMQVIPAGRYRAVIVKSEWKPTKAGNGEYLELWLEVVAGDHKGARIPARLNLKNQSSQAVQIARAELSAICHAVNVMKPQDSQALHNIPLVISVAVKSFTAKDGSESHGNEIKKYESTEAAGDINQPVAATAGATGQPKEKAPWEE